MGTLNTPEEPPQIVLRFKTGELVRDVQPTRAIEIDDDLAGQEPV